jgi:glutamyl-tRNA(Gln) amidotransferase subunit D
MKGYSKTLQEIFAAKEIEVGDRIRIEKNGKTYEGLLMPRIMGDKNVIILKLDNGYNIGIEFNETVKIEKISGHKEKTERGKVEVKPDPTKPTIVILSTGGTIASKIDYRTGAVKPAFTAEDLFEAVPELKEIANIKPKTVMQVYSESMNFEHYEKLAKEIAKEIGKCDGIVVAHGTDTMHYSASALSFALQNLPIPIVFVGSQRSSDRGSSDAAINLISAILFASANTSGVFICMHENMSDETCVILRGVTARKLHTSRRDAFKSVNTKPVARIFWKEKRIEWIEKPIERNKNRKVETKPKFERKVALIKLHPGFDPKLIEFLIKEGYKGLVLEGTGLGHAPDYTFKVIEKACKRMTVCMTSQCIFGRVNMNVYYPGRDLQRMGVVPCEMLPETAFIKLSWLLGNFKDKEKIKELMRKNLVGEIPERILEEV